MVQERIMLDASFISAKKMDEMAKGELCAPGELTAMTIAASPMDRRRRSGLTALSQEAQLSEMVRQMVEEGVDAGGEDTTHSSYRNRRRGVGGSPSSSAATAIQRSRAVDLDEDDDARREADIPSESLLLAAEGPSISSAMAIALGKDSDGDMDVKRDILEGMSQAQAAIIGRGCAGIDFQSLPSTIPGGSVTGQTSGSLDNRECNKPRRRGGGSGDSAKSRLLMPDLMENSETESAKNSGESVESEPDPATMMGPMTTDDGILLPPTLLPLPQSSAVSGSGDSASPAAFPSLPDFFLKQLGVNKDSTERTEVLPEQDVESKFGSLSLAFKTDRFTLGKRLELQQRQRDLAEKNIDGEIQALKENLNALSQLCTSDEIRELVKRLHHHLEVLHQSTVRMSSRAEVYGAVQQEERTSKAIEVMVLYVENLKRIRDRTGQELEELRRLMIDNNLQLEGGEEMEDGRRSHRTLSMSSGISPAKTVCTRRRASIASLPRSTADRLDSKSKFINIVTNAASRNSVCSIGGRRCSLLYTLRPLVAPQPQQSGPLSNQTEVVPADANHCLISDEHLARYHISDEYRHSLAPRTGFLRLAANSDRPSTLDKSQQTETCCCHIGDVADSPICSPCCESCADYCIESQRVTTSTMSRVSSMPSLSNGDLSDIAMQSSPRSNYQGKIQCLPSCSQSHLARGSYLADPSEVEDNDPDDEADGDFSANCQSHLRPTRKNTRSGTESQRTSSRAVDARKRWRSMVCIVEWLRWVPPSSQSIRMMRLTAGGLLLLAAIFSLAMTFFSSPPSASAQCTSFGHGSPRRPDWWSGNIEEMFRPNMKLQRARGEPPPPI